MERTDLSFARKAMLAVLIALLMVLFVAFFALALDLVLLIMCGTLAAIALNRLANLLKRFTRLPYGWAFALAILLVTAVIGSLAFLVGAQIANHAAELFAQVSKSLEDFVARLREEPWGQWFLQQMPSIVSPVAASEGTSEDKSAMADAQQMVQQVGGADGILTAITSFFSFTGGTLLSLIVIALLAIYLAYDPNTYRRGAAKLLPVPLRAKFLDVLNQIGETLWWWVIGRLVGMLIIGVLSTIGLYLIGIPMALPLGVMAGLLNFIPNVGPTLALGPPLLFGLQQSPMTAVYVFCLYLGLQFVETYVITPLIEQHQVNLPPGVTIPVQVLFGLVAGVFGVAMATPLAVVVMVLVREYYVKDVLGDHSTGLNDMPGVPSG